VVHVEGAEFGDYEVEVYAPDGFLLGGAYGADGFEGVEGFDYS